MDGENNDKEILSVDIYEPGWISLGGTSFSFSGQCSVSENGKYILAWKDAWIQEDELTGKETFVDGEYLLLESKQLILKGTLRRPNYGEVANNGKFIFNDWLSFSGGLNGHELEGNFIAYNKKGEEIVNHHYLANLKNNKLSNDGRYAICQTWHSDTADGNTVSLFDLETGKLLWQKVPETRSADSFEFSTAENIIVFVYDNMGKFRYSLKGDLLDSEQWYRASINHSTGYELIEIAEQKLMAMDNPINLSTLKDALSLYLLAIEKMDSPYFLAKAHRRTGDIYELMGEKDKTIIHYEQALKHNPQIGLKKKLQKLKSEL